MTTHEKALKAAARAWLDTTGPGTDPLEDAIAAYNSALLPEDAAGLVRRLESLAERAGVLIEADHRTILEAASLIQSQAARIAELEAGLEPFADVADHDIGTDEADDDVFRPMTNHNSAAKITVGHMRRTVALLTKDRQP